ncbi:hypothetical protein P9112_005340 [Eukaryota sp. TZLM1-RC]
MSRLTLRAVELERDLLQSECQALRAKLNRMKTTHASDVESLQHICTIQAETLHEAGLDPPVDTTILQSSTSPIIHSEAFAVLNMENTVETLTNDFSKELSTLHTDLNNVIDENVRLRETITMSEAETQSTREELTRETNNLSSRISSLELALAVSEENVRMVRRDRDDAISHVEQLQSELRRLVGSTDVEGNEALVLDLFNVLSLLGGEYEDFEEEAVSSDDD